jgi:hypothetical protein
MVDVVDMLVAFEAKRKRAAKPIFEVEQWAISGGHHVRATLPDGTVGPDRPQMMRGAGLRTSQRLGLIGVERRRNNP